MHFVPSEVVCVLRLLNLYLIIFCSIAELEKSPLLSEDIYQMAVLKTGV